MPEPLDESLPEVGNDEDMPMSEPADKRSGQDRRQFAFGYPGPDRRDGLEQRGGKEPLD